MHFRPQHALSSLHTFNLLDLIAQTPGGFILVKQGKRCQDSQRETFSTPRTTDSFVVSLGLFCVCLEEQRICGEQRLTIQCKAADGMCDLTKKGTWRTAGWWRIIRLSWFTANSSVTDALCWQPNNPHGHGDDTLIIMVDGWWLLLVLMVRPTLEGLLSYRNRLIAAWRCSAECRVGPLLFETWRLWRDFKVKSRFGVRKYDLVTDSSLQVTF